MASLVVLASGWSVWLAWDQPALSAFSALGGFVGLLLALRRGKQAAWGTLRVDAQGHAFWRDARAAPAPHPAVDIAAHHTSGAVEQPVTVPRWHRSEHSVWIRIDRSRLGAPGSVGNENAPRGSLSADLSINSQQVSPGQWAALQRWLLWMERGASR